MALSFPLANPRIPKPEIPKRYFAYEPPKRGLGFRVWGLGFGVWGLGFAKGAPILIYLGLKVPPIYTGTLGPKYLIMRYMDP